MMHVTDTLGPTDGMYTPLQSPWDKKAQENYGETPEKCKECLIKLRNMVEDDGGFHCSTSDSYLLRYLRVGKFDVERSFKKLKKRLSLQRSHPELFVKESLDELLSVESSNMGVVLLDRTVEGHVIGLLRTDKWDPDIHSADDWLKLLITHVEFLSSADPLTQTFGFISIFDFKNMNFKKVRHCSPTFLYKFVTVMQDSLSGRYHQIHIINENVFFQTVYNLWYPFFSKKVKSRVFLHGKDIESLHKYVSPEILPEEFGGTKGPADYKPFWNIMKENEKQIVDYCNYYYESPTEQN